MNLIERFNFVDLFVDLIVAFDPRASSLLGRIQNSARHGAYNEVLIN